MRTSRLLALAISTAVIGGSAGAVHAEPSEPQRLRGMEGRSFVVDVFVGVEKLFGNCYTFDADGVWIDTAALPATGTWQQSGVGAATSYTASLATPLGPIEQRGTVTPAGGRGVLQLRAVTDVPAGILGNEAPALRLTSIGHEVDDC